MTIEKTIEESLNKVLKQQKEKFNFFLENSYGWEKWFQIELAHELAKNGESYIETQLPYSKAKNLPIKNEGNSNAFIDIIFRKTNFTKDYYTAVEITVSKTKQGLRKALSDLLRLKAIKTKHWPFRSVYIILAYSTEYQKESKFEKIIESIEKEMIVKKITAGSFTFLIFGWNSKGHQKNMTIESYRNWLSKIVKIYRHHGIRPKLTKKSRLTNNQN